MEVVLDSNILFRMLISSGDIIELFFNHNLIIYAPQRIWEEFCKNEEEILQKSHLTKNDFQELCDLLINKIIFIRLEEYRKYLPTAKKLLKEHKKDEDFIALCILKECKLWTYEKLLFEIGFGISTREISRLIQ